MDFFSVGVLTKGNKTEIFPIFKIGKIKDLMIRGKAFYAIWDEDRNLWSTDETDVARIVDEELSKTFDEMKSTGIIPEVKWMSNYSSGSWTSYCSFVKQSPDAYHDLDAEILFSNSVITKKSYATKSLSYPLEEGKYEAYDQIIRTLYEPDERQKIEWAIGSIIAGDSKSIQKFLVLYGEAGAGKSTILNIIQKLFEGYYKVFDARSIGSSSNQFAVEQFRTNPLIAIQHDGDLSRIEDNTKLNSIVSHEEMTINEKYKSSYSIKLNTFLFMATNKPVKITDAKSGVIRRLIDVRPSGNKLPISLYNQLYSQIGFELSGIAWHCLEVYKSLGKNFYNSYVPFGMMFETDVFFNFVDENFDAFLDMEGIALKQAYQMYKQYCEDTLVEFKLPMYKFREELKHYFREYHDRITIDGNRYLKYYTGFRDELFVKTETPPVLTCALTLSAIKSPLDELLKDCPAQYGNTEETPQYKWKNVKTTLSDIQTSELHYVKPPLNHIVIDFDLKDRNGHKDKAKNLEAAAKWPATYAELSKGGNGVHLHYVYDGDPTTLSRIYADGIEVKVFTGDSSLRRKLSFCNTLPVATIKSGLPLKEEKMINFDAVKSENGLRSMIARNLQKEFHPGTKPSVDFIYKILEDAYTSGLRYDVTDMRNKVLNFALGSTHHSEYCMKVVAMMKFKSDQDDASETPQEKHEDQRLVFYDVEVFPNLFLVNWKYQGAEGPCTRMINPTPQEIGEFLKMPLVGFNCRRYDNHILYARYIGYSIEDLFKLSQKIINSGKTGPRDGFFSEAYNISYTDVYDFASKKQSLKKWEIELGLHHQELGLPWNQPVPEERWAEVAEYCDNDVISTEAVFNARQADFTGRKILAMLSGLSVNDSTQSHAARILFGNDRHPQDKFVYTDLSEMFPGYKYENGKSTYRGEEVGEGGYVYAEPGMHFNVALLDISSMHPTSIEQLNLFGPYTKNFSDIKRSRIAIKHEDMEQIATLLDGKLQKALDEMPGITLDDLAYSMKIIINMIYGFTSATFDSKFRDPRNKDNIVAKRGALFMVNLKHEVQERGFTVAHIKTDSIKVPNATPEIIEFITDYGRQYGYEFEHEATYDRMCLVNNAVYIAKYDAMGIRNKGGKHAGEWTATGAQFAHPYVFKTLFSHEPITFDDYCEAKAVTSEMYLDMNEGLPDVVLVEKEKEKLLKRITQGILSKEEDTESIEQRLAELNDKIARGHQYVFIGKVGLFVPIKPGRGGGVLYRIKDGKYYAVTDTTGYRWLEAEMVKNLGKEEDIDKSYARHLVDDAIANISKYGDFEMLANGPPIPPWTSADGPEAQPSWVVPF